MQEPSSSSGSAGRRESLGVVMVTLMGACLRFWPIGRLGLTHFDEGIYALASTWSLTPRGLGGLDPSLISYAPPGYPILGGLLYAILGRSDSAMILVSQLAGIATIPVVAWLGRRTFGPGAGFVSAVFCALSGPHIAFSRMALTDASSALGCGFWNVPDSSGP
jgi:4-amino-4-deoxy-L-arabinose transferase-like glycosyltransferase